MKKILLLSAILIFSAAIITAAAEARHPAVAGRFYPNDPDELKQMVKGHLDKVENLPEIDGQIIALISPHAGLVYSGQIAAYGYKLLENSGIDKVILVGPSHQYPFEGVSVYGPGVTWSTPLGDVSCNTKLCQKLIDSGREIKAIEAAHKREHCLEVQLPYLQTVLSNFTIVPAVMGRPDMKTVEALTEALGKIEMDNQTVIISSTDWQHYQPAAVGKPQDSLGLKCITDLDPDLLARYLAAEKTSACGGAPMVAVVKAAIAHGADRALILKYGDSGDLTGDKSSVVGYASVVLYKANGTKDKKPAEEHLSKEDKKLLLEIARKTVETFVKTGRAPSFEVPDNLKESGAAFVTLEKNGRLRGCIGHTVAQLPLYKTVINCAVSAATKDPRFRPVTPNELDDLHIEISVLTPLVKIESLDEIKVGRDGLMIFKGRNRGLLLPQVATDYGWTRTEFLEHTCQKAGIDINAYKSKDAEIYKFQALIFAE
ncbi:MAG: AmmeMemoRadiSam system protein B [FCB group bacterium]|nr:AmmeMemoRadiSam system protein B [FCB group bacterium]